MDPRYGSTARLRFARHASMTANPLQNRTDPSLYDRCCVALPIAGQPVPEHAQGCDPAAARRRDARGQRVRGCPSPWHVWRARECDPQLTGGT